MTPSPAGGRSPDAPLDEADFALLDQLRDLYAAADPMPDDLPERLTFSLALRDLEAEVARLAAEEDRPLLTARGPEQSRTITFDSDSLTIMIRIDLNRDGSARVDGWLAPAQRREVEIKTPAEALSVTSDDQGRFAFASVPRGMAQIVVRPDGGGASGTTASQEPRAAGAGSASGAGGAGTAGGDAGRGGRAVVTPALML
jgi:hypothetical protein